MEEKLIIVIDMQKAILLKINHSLYLSELRTSVKELSDR